VADSCGKALVAGIRAGSSGVLENTKCGQNAANCVRKPACQVPQMTRRDTCEYAVSMIPRAVSSSFEAM
jgi:hypothetical protein